jgi:vancomycin resistance protein YoaR
MRPADHGRRSARAVRVLAVAAVALSVAAAAHTSSSRAGRDVAPREAAARTAAAPTRADARLELVASFTTRYTPGQPRVVNIRRAAQLLDGRVIPAGGRFSMNDALGKRTRARGFVPAPMISGGRLVPSVGGGISQVATTLYNAAFFAGLEIVTSTPHSFYIDRYPMGREATISWGGPELVFRNQWAAPLRMRLRATQSAITVRFYSQPLGRRVASWTGKPYAWVRPVTVRVPTQGLPVGAVRVVQDAGEAGFSIAYGRRVYRDGRLQANTRYHARYEAHNRIVEVGVNRRGGR